MVIIDLENLYIGFYDLNIFYNVICSGCIQLVLQIMLADG